MIQEFSTQLQVWGVGDDASLYHRKAFIHKVRKKPHNAKMKNHYDCNVTFDMLHVLDLGQCMC
jgi:hypothetical protein